LLAVQLIAQAVITMEGKMSIANFAHGPNGEMVMVQPPQLLQGVMLQQGVAMQLLDVVTLVALRSKNSPRPSSIAGPEAYASCTSESGFGKNAYGGGRFSEAPQRLDVNQNRVGGSGKLTRVCGRASAVDALLRVRGLAIDLGIHDLSVPRQATRLPAGQS